MATSLLYLGPYPGPCSTLGTAGLGGIYIYRCWVAIGAACWGVIGVGICVLDSVVAVAIGWVGRRISGVGALVTRGRVEAVAVGSNC